MRFPFFFRSSPVTDASCVRLAETSTHPWGWGATRLIKFKKKFGWINKKNKEAPKNVGIVDDEDSEFQKVKKKNWARLIAREIFIP